MSSVDMQTVILAGGQGMRLRPYTHTIPKPMVKVNGIPFLEFLITYLSQFGLKKFLIIVGYLPAEIPNYFNSGERLGVNMQYTGDERNLLVGTGGALKNAKEKLEDNFLLLFGDSFLPINYNSLITEFKNQDRTATIAIYDNHENTDVINNIEIDNNGLVITYRKNDPIKKLKYVDAGVLCCKKKIIDYIPDGMTSLEEIVYPGLIRENQLSGFISKNRFYDIGTPERLNLFSQKIYDYIQDTS